MSRVFLIVLDSFGIGEMPDAEKFGDKGSDTLKAIYSSSKFHASNLQRLGLFNIDGVNVGEREKVPVGCYARLKESSMGKDTTTGHWEMAGIISSKPMPTFPNGFPQIVLEKLTEISGRKCLCNLPYSGTQVINDFGAEQLKNGGLIVYTSADSVLQIAGHEDLIPVDELYDYCQKIRKFMVGEFGVGRVIARPFKGVFPNFYRTENRHDFSLEPPCDTMLDILQKNGRQTISIGKIVDIFASRGIDEYYRTKNNREGIQMTKKIQEENFDGLCFVNLVDFDMLYGHRNDVDGYANAISYFDKWLPAFMDDMRDEDILFITGDHGCDPSTPSTDHSREYVPLLCYGKSLKQNVNLGTRQTFADISATILDLFGLKGKVGESFYNLIKG